jgi:hypothetical protein
MGMISVQVWDATGNKRQTVEVPDDAMNRLIAFRWVNELPLRPDASPELQFHHRASGSKSLTTVPCRCGGEGGGYLALTARNHGQDARRDWAFRENPPERETAATPFAFTPGKPADSADADRLGGSSSSPGGTKIVSRPLLSRGALGKSLKISCSAKQF